MNPPEAQRRTTIPMTSSYNQAFAVLDIQEDFSSREISFWRKDDPILEEGSHRIITGGMWEHQRNWWSLPNFIKILVGGYGAGKTLAISKRMISLALQNAPAPVAIISPTFAIARQTTIETIATLLAGKQRILGRKFWWRYNASSHEFRIRFRGRLGRIIVYSGDNPLSLRGPNLAAAGIDEPFIQEEEVFKQMLARVRHPGASRKEICLSGTPEQLNWGYDLCLGESSGDYDVGFIQASTRANRAIDPSYVKRLEGAYSEEEAQAYIDGAFMNLGAGLVYHAFSTALHVKKVEEIPEGAELGCGMDFNVDPMSAAVFWRFRDRIHFFQEITLSNSDTEFMCDVLRERFGEKLQTIYPDASGASRHSSAPGGKTDFYYIRNAGFQIDAPPENPKRRDRYNSVNGKFKARDGSITLTIDPGCKKLIKALNVYSYELMNKQQDLSHLLDAFSYPVARLFPVDRKTMSWQKIIGA
jgi:hypothetical protein